MPILLRNLRLELDEPVEELRARAAQRLRVPVEAVRQYAVVRRAVDARRADDVHFVYQIELALAEEADETAAMRRLRANEAAMLDPVAPPEPTPGSAPLPERPLIIGFGPGGMFAAWRLAKWGYKPIVIERGQPVRTRHRDVLQRFYRDRDFDPESNLLFGEGGAGTYSDGKLYTRIRDPLNRTVLEALYHHGATPDIMVNARPHIGSDRLPRVCWKLRERIEELGGEVRFGQCVDDLRVEAGRLTGVRVGEEWHGAAPTILAIGHSARDTIRMLAERGVKIVSKPFQIGVRIEHPQELVDRWQYGSQAGHVCLEAAEYQVVAREAAGAYGDLFSFCMCPGGMILPSNEAAGLVATNGASRARRSSPFANSGLVITLDPAAMWLGPLQAMDFQKHWEEAAFAAAGADYHVPAQRAEDFLAERSSDGEMSVSYPLGGKWTELASILPQQVADALRRGLPILDQKLPGFAGAEAMLTGPETRASAPFRIQRDQQTREAVETAGLYPVGEGAGYAGGIMSAAVDGIRSADCIISRYAPPR
jgi:uncharacterized FAD-dependent dehydrogenase